jgi:hypothetical protein
MKLQGVSTGNREIPIVPGLVRNIDSQIIREQEKQNTYDSNMFKKY